MPPRLAPATHSPRSKPLVDRRPAHDPRITGQDVGHPPLAVPLPPQCDLDADSPFDDGRRLTCGWCQRTTYADRMVVPAAEAQAAMLRPLLEARSVAIVGASTRPGSFGNALGRQGGAWPALEPRRRGG